MSDLGNPGDFCPHESCPDYGKLQTDGHNNLFKFGKTANGIQRYRCKSCQKTFSENRGTIFYYRHVPESEIIESLAMIAEGNRISAVSRIKGYKADTIAEWLKVAAAHVKEIEALLMKNHRVKRAQIDALWSYVKHKGVKKTISKQKKKAPSGVQP